MDNNKFKKIVVAMSGGVDSSVAAALLKRVGFDVVGVHMKFWSEGKSGAENRCCSTEAEKMARMVAKKIGIPFYVFNFKKEFKKKVVDYFLKEYKAGRTPNPCVVCNKEIKFGLLLEKALKLGADYVATGHYARTEFAQNRRVFFATAKNTRRFWEGGKGEGGKLIKLLKGKDKNKDQSYFLWRLNQKQLKHILFTVGDYTKEEVRKLAKKFNLPTAKTPESQEICFVSANINDFLARFIKPRPGPVVEQVHYGVKKIIGKHQGLFSYTIGQRKGIGLSGGPYYVVDKDIKENFLIVSKNEKDLYKKELIVKNVNWILGEPPKLPLKVTVKIRYRHEAVPAAIKGQKNGKIKVVFKKPQRAITPGQSAVFYNGTELLGGGTIN